MCYTDWYGKSRVGTTLCKDHERLLKLYDSLYIASYAEVSEASSRVRDALDAQLHNELTQLLNHAKSLGEEWLEPNKDYGFIK